MNRKQTLIALVLLAVLAVAGAAAWLYTRSAPLPDADAGSSA